MSRVNEEENRDALMKVEEGATAEFDANAEEVLANTSKNCVFIKSQDYFRKVMFKDILFLEASGSYCNIYLKNRVRLTVTHPLTQTARHLAKGPFLRVHRSFIVNVEHVDSYIGNVFYIGEHTVPIGRMYKKTILNGLNLLGAREV